MSEADMDFPPDPLIVEAVTARFAEAVGYPPPYVDSEVTEVLASFYRRRYGFEVPHEGFWLHTGTVQAARLLFDALLEPGDEVLYFRPSFRPIHEVVSTAGGVPRPVDLHPGPQPAFDVEQLRRSVNERTRAIYLCNPHNPTGHVFTPAELELLAEIAERHDLTIISNELHSRLVLSGTHHLVARAGPAASRTITLSGPTKSHNIAGIGGGFAFSANTALISTLKARVGYRLGSARGVQQAAMTAAYRCDSPWLADTLARICDAQKRLGTAVLQSAPWVRFRPAPATYFLWLDFSARPATAAAEQLRDRCRVAGLPGTDFGAPATHVRLAYATHPWIIDEVVARVRSGLV
jgi:bifunctional pyridoxal-dependent enzyme with beta-cystathionase and maltose regulon repressor activities